MNDETTTPEPEAFNAAGLDDAALTAEYERIRSRGQELSAKSELSADEASELSSLAERSPLVTAELDARAARVAEQQAQRDAFASLPERSLPTVTPIASIQKSDEKASVPVSAPAAPAQVSVPSVAEMSAQTPVQPAPGHQGGKDTITAHVLANASGFVEKPVGAQYESSAEISKAFIANARSFGRRGSGRQPIVQFRRNRGEEFTAAGDNGPEFMAKLRNARDERRLHGGSLAKQWQHNIDQGMSLTAAAGWCAPSQNDYDLCRGWSSGVGLIDLPTVSVTRGGINYTDEPTFPEIYANAIAVGGGSNFLTEAQVIADTLKTCSEIPCPTFEDRRLDVMALCIRVSFLQAAGYPEVIDAWTDGLMVAHEQEMNRIIIADIIARAGAATTVTPVDPDGDSFTSATLAAVGLAAEDIRYRFMMSWTDTVEIILPHWVLPQIRADLSRRSGDTGNILSVTDSYIASLFSAMNVRVQFVRGWQDGLVTGGALVGTLPGGDAATPFLTALPTTVSFLAFPAGSVAVARQDVVTLTNVYDASSLAVNEFTSLFTEEGFAPVYPCPGQRLYTYSGCPGGITGAHQINCTDDTP